MPTNMKVNKAEIQLKQTAGTFLSYDQEEIIRKLDPVHDDKTFTLTFIGKTYVIDRQSAAVTRDGEAADLDEIASLFEYLTKSEHRPQPTGQWESIASLCTNTTDTSLTRYIEYLEPFKEDTDLMQKALLKLGAVPAKKGDASAVLEIMEGIPVWFQYWAADDEFPASIQFLFDRSITDHFKWSILWNVMTCITNRMNEEREKGL